MVIFCTSSEYTKNKGAFPSSHSCVSCRNMDEAQLENHLYMLHIYNKNLIHQKKSQKKYKKKEKNIPEWSVPIGMKKK